MLSIFLFFILVLFVAATRCVWETFRWVFCGVKRPKRRKWRTTGLKGINIRKLGGPSK